MDTPDKKPLNLQRVDPDEFERAAVKFIRTPKPAGGWPKMPNLPGSNESTREGNGK